MKTGVALLAVLGLSGAAVPQEIEKGSRYDQFISRPGVLVLKSAVVIGELHWTGGPVRVLALHAYEPEKKDKGVFALRFELTPPDRRPSEAGASVDVDECAGLASALEKMSKAVKEWANGSRERDDLQLTTRGEFCVGISQQGYKQWAFINLGKATKGSVTSNSVDSLRDVREMTEKGLAKLRDLGAKP